MLTKIIFSCDLLNTLQGIFYDLFFTRPLFVVHVYIAAVVIICSSDLLRLNHKTGVAASRVPIYNINYNILYIYTYIIGVYILYKYKHAGAGLCASLDVTMTHALLKLELKLFAMMVNPYLFYIIIEVYQYKFI